MLVHFKSDPLYHQWEKGWSLGVVQNHADPAPGKGWPVRGFIIAGPDRKFVKAEAQIVGAHAVEVWSESVAEPAAVRYAWQVWPDATLVACLKWLPGPSTPVHPFRTDEWPLK